MQWHESEVGPGNEVPAIVEIHAWNKLLGQVNIALGIMAGQGLLYASGPYAAR